MGVWGDSYGVVVGWGLIVMGWWVFGVDSYGVVGWLVEWGFYALSASKAIFRARTYNCNLFSLVMMIT